MTMTSAPSPFSAIADGAHPTAHTAQASSIAATAYPAGARNYARLLESGAQASTLREGERGTVAAGFDELELQARWFAGEFGRRFSTPSGEPVEIVQFGHWNRCAGPDFTECAVRVGDRVLHGAIEIDVDARDWEHHGHGSNPAFDDVVLHLFLHRPEHAIFFTRNSRHREVAQAELDLGRFDTTRSVAGFVPEAKLGRCAAPLETMEPERIAGLLTAAALHRMRKKAQRFQAIRAVQGREQALWIGVAEALGYRHNRLPMAVLAQRLPIAFLKECDAADTEALLFGAAGFLDCAQHTRQEGTEEATQLYLRQLWQHWWKLRTDHELGPERALQWTLSGTRPLNHPHRRIAALARVARHWPEFLDAVDFKAELRWTKPLHDLLGHLHHPYWSRHYTLRSQQADTRMALIGRDRVHDLVGNVVVPLVFADRPELWSRFVTLPAALDNQSLRRARLRLFGRNQSAARVFSRRYFQQQALLQIYRDFCLEDHSECANCPFPEQLAQWR